MGPKHIPDRLYKQILQVMPVACVDAVIVHRGKFLLGKRTNKPAKGQWFVIGGRVLKGESLAHAVLRHIKAETGIRKIRIKKLLTAAATTFKNSAQGPSSHTINSVFLVGVPTKDFFLNDENRTIRWFSKIDKKWHPYVKAVLRLAGFG